MHGHSDRQHCAISKRDLRGLEEARNVAGAFTLAADRQVVRDPSRCHNVSFGSEGEKLTLSRCFPVCRDKQTYVRALMILYNRQNWTVQTYDRRARPDASKP